MPYEYLEDVALSDVAFRAWGTTLEEMFVSAADAVTNTMVEDLEGIADQVRRPIHVQDTEIDMLLFEFLQEVIFFKDAERLLLRVPDVGIEEEGGIYLLRAEGRGETLNASKHELLVDVKAVTLHRYRVEKKDSGWEATVILDT